MADRNTPSFPPEKRQKAVALEYLVGKDEAPRITASGQGHIAEQILQIAFANGINVREDADLVEILSVLEVDSVIPLEAYAAVGEILTYVYKANARGVRLNTKKRNQDSIASTTEDDQHE